MAAVLPFRVNNYVVENLINWDAVPDEPIFQLTFPQKGMLAPSDHSRMCDLVARGADESTIRGAARAIQSRLNPHPSGQIELNVPKVDGREVRGMQHKYRETLLFFPSQGPTCHAYCTHCFRWAQFVGIRELRFANREVDELVAYFKAPREVSSVLFTGGDPLVMRAKVLRSYIEPLLDNGLDQLLSIRLGTKAPAYGPYRFLADPDADDLLRLFEDVRSAGLHLALMAHYSHPRELETAAAQAAIRRIQDAGGVVRCQAPLIRHVNDAPEVWSDMWKLQVRLGAVPYYMFVERDTGPKNYFEVPLARALRIFQQAYRQVSGLARTVRGPVMSATPGKVLIDGVATIDDEDVFVLNFLQARIPQWTGRPFFAKYDRRTAWLDQLQPALGEEEFFFERRMQELRQRRHERGWSLRRRGESPDSGSSPFRERGRSRIENAGSEDAEMGRYRQRNKSLDGVAFSGTQ